MCPVKNNMSILIELLNGKFYRSTMLHYSVPSKSINNVLYIHIRFPSIRFLFEFIRIYLLILEDVYACSDVNIN